MNGPINCAQFMADLSFECHTYKNIIGIISITPTGNTPHGLCCVCAICMLTVCCTLVVELSSTKSPQHKWHIEAKSRFYGSQLKSSAGGNNVSIAFAIKEDYYLTVVDFFSKFVKN